jgi:hypothetical protein
MKVSSLLDWMRRSVSTTMLGKALLATSLLLPCIASASLEDRIVRSGFEAPALPSDGAQLLATPDAFFTSQPTQVRFQARLLGSPGGIFSRVDLYRAGDGNRPVGAPLCELQDNGQLDNGDDIRGDSVFSCFVTFTEGAPGEIHLVVHAISAATDDSARLGPLFAVNPLTTQQSETLVATQAAAMSSWAQNLDTLGDTLAAREATVAEIVGMAGVDATGISSDGNTIWIKYDSGINGGVLTNPDGTRGAMQRISAPMRFDGSVEILPGRFSAVASAAPMRMSTHDPEVQSTDVLIYDAYHSEFAPDDEGPELRALYEGAQCPLFDVHYLFDAEATVDALRNLTRYGTVILITHGAVDGDDQVIFLTRETASIGSVMQKAIELLLGRISVVGSVFAIRPSFIDRLEGSFPAALVYNGSCESSANATMADAFLGKGAETYYGFNRVVNSAFARSAALGLFESLVTDREPTGVAFAGVSPITDPVGPNATFIQHGATELVYSSDLRDGGFESGALGAWSSSGDGRVISSLGAFGPTEGGFMGIISTGLGFTTTSGQIEQSVCLPPNATALSFAWNFSSEEFIEYCNSSFDDQFVVELESGDTTHTLLQTGVNVLCANEGQGLMQTSLAFDASLPPCTPTSGAGYSTGGNDCRVWSTGWIQQSVDVSGIAAGAGGEGVKLRFRATDVGDSIFDSAILLDDIRLTVP